MAQGLGEKISKLLLLCVVFLSASFFLVLNTSSLLNRVKNFISERLLVVEPLPPVYYKSTSNSKNVIYVLGGSERSLESRFKTAFRLYKEGLAPRILVLNEPCITAYDTSIRRNLTNNEWDIKKLTELGVKEKDIELVSIKKMFFGTFSEAKSVTEFVKKKGYGRLILVTSPYHTRRVWITFSSFIKKSDGLNLYVYASDDSALLRGLLFEYLKLLVYENVLIKLF